MRATVFQLLSRCLPAGRALVVLLFLPALGAVALAQAQAADLSLEPGFAPQLRAGFTEGDQWEPAIASDAYGHVYILYPQYGQVPQCPTCPLPSMTFLSSHDNGASWDAPRQIAPPASGQFDPQIAVDPADHRTLYAAWLQNDRTEIVIAKSADFGQSWSMVIADRALSDIDKPVLAVRGQDVYVAFSRGRKMLVAASHDGGITFSTNSVMPNSRFIEALAGGATVDPAGKLFVGWAGYTRQLGVRGRAYLFVSQSADGGDGWTTLPLGTSGAPADCSPFRCGWAYLGAQITVASDAAGTVYALWNASASDRGAGRIYFSSSTTGGAIWSQRIDVSGAEAGVVHAFPAITAGSAGDVRIGWMDARRNLQWNTFYRGSTNGGATWSDEKQLSSFVNGYSYITPNGFRFPFGDYFQMAIDNRGQTQVVWGEGWNFRSPGSIWYSSGR